MKDFIEQYQRMYLERHVPNSIEEREHAMRVVAGRCDYPDQVEEALMALGLIDYRY